MYIVHTDMQWGPVQSNILNLMTSNLSALNCCIRKIPILIRVNRVEQEFLNTVFFHSLITLSYSYTNWNALRGQCWSLSSRCTESCCVRCTVMFVFYVFHLVSIGMLATCLKQLCITESHITNALFFTYSLFHRLRLFFINLSSFSLANISLRQKNVFIVVLG